MKDEKGIFFCENCGGTILKKMRYEEKPSDDCGNCGFNNWIFEPMEEEILVSETISKKALTDWLQQEADDRKKLTHLEGNRLSYLRVKERVESGCFDVVTMPRSLDEWHEDYGDVLWWSFPIQEPPYCGSPLDADWPDYHTHWTPIVTSEQPKE